MIIKSKESGDNDESRRISAINIIVDALENVKEVANKHGIIWTIVHPLLQPRTLLIGLPTSGAVRWRGSDFYQISHVSRDSKHDAIW